MKYELSDVRALLSLVERHDKLGVADVRFILRTHGEGACNVFELDSDHYDEVATVATLALAMTHSASHRMIPEERIEVYNALDNERDHQDAEHPNFPGIPGTMLIIRKLLADAEHHWYYDNHNFDVLNHFRKIGASCVRAMEICGVVDRDIYRSET